MTHVQAIRRSASSLSALVDDLLDVSRADGGQLTLERTPFDFQSLLQEFSSAAQTVTSKKHQRLKIDNFNESVWVIGDQARISQVLNNLISNASKYSPDETDITLTAALHSGRVEVAVVDEGIGVSPHNLDNVFTPFFRAENIETQRETGTGLGLTVVKALVELHGGQVEIESEPGRGTSVNFWIPGVTEQPAS